MENSGFLPDSGVIGRYASALQKFNNAVTCALAGTPDNFTTLLNRWHSSEKEYANHGFRTISLDDLDEDNDEIKSIDSLLGVKRAIDEPAKLHAEAFRRKYLRLDGEGPSSQGHYELASALGAMGK